MLDKILDIAIDAGKKVIGVLANEAETALDKKKKEIEEENKQKQQEEKEETEE